MKNKNIMRKAGVSFFVAFMILSTIIVTGNTIPTEEMEKYGFYDKRDGMLYKKIAEISFIGNCGKIFDTTIEE